MKALALTNLTKAGTAPADVVWGEFAGIAYLRGHPDAALWAEMHALVRNWRAEYVAHAGVYLLSLKNTDDAKLFLHCAYDMGWRSATLCVRRGLQVVRLEAKVQNGIDVAGFGDRFRLARSAHQMVSQLFREVGY